ncbi:MAG TPA: hypothetical protein ENJ75_01185 [Candidatus Kaiserbacteria bacterium]|nr:hypothetical protein [Candidatus Kaiserbacteria bacterium]
MNIEELTKSQLLLLTVLVTFVTSIATGILTVSLLDQAPQVVTRTINQVVERTVKTVAPALPATVIKTITQAPAPSNEDLVTSALSAQDSRTVLVYSVDASTSTPAIAVGTYIPSAHAVVTAKAKKLPTKASIEFPNGSVVLATLTNTVGGLSRYDISDKAKTPKVSNPKLVPAKNLRLGETVLAIRGDGSATTGIVSQVTSKGVHTTLPSIGAGVGAVDLSGNLIGIATGDAKGLFVSSDVVASLLTATSKNATTTSKTTKNTSVKQ